MYEVNECRKFKYEWLATFIDMESEGECYMVRFTGPDAQKRAEEYAAWKNSMVSVNI